MASAPESTVQQTSQSCSLTSLPIETQYEIYSYIYAASSTTLLPRSKLEVWHHPYLLTPDPTNPNDEFCIIDNFSSLLLTCRQIYVIAKTFRSTGKNDWTLNVYRARDLENAPHLIRNKVRVLRLILGKRIGWPTRIPEHKPFDYKLVTCFQLRRIEIIRTTSFPIERLRTNGGPCWNKYADPSGSEFIKRGWMYWRELYANLDWSTMPSDFDIIVRLRYQIMQSRRHAALDKVVGIVMRLLPPDNSDRFATPQGKVLTWILRDTMENGDARLRVWEDPKDARSCGIRNPQEGTTIVGNIPSQYTWVQLVSKTLNIEDFNSIGNIPSAALKPGGLYIGR